MNLVNPVNPVGFANGGRVRLFIIGLLGLLAAFAWPLFRLVQLALHEEIQSHILLIPFVSLYLWKTSRSVREPLNSKLETPGRSARGGTGVSPVPAGVPPGAHSSHSIAQLETRHSTFDIPLLSFPLAVLGLAMLAVHLLWARQAFAPNDALCFSILSFLLLFYALALATIGSHVFRCHLFAFMFLLFMIPLPTAFIEFLNVALQHASAEAASWMLSLTGMPFVRDGLSFQFTNLSIRVAEECSGIRSTFVLFITSMLAGHLFLRTGWKKALLVIAIFPLGILRNGFRITVISWLTVNVDRGVIDSPLHHRGGPVFFIVSLLPLFLMLWLFRRSDRAARGDYRRPRIRG